MHVPAGADYLQQIVLWLAFLGGLVATRERKHLTLSTAELFGDETTPLRRAGRVLAAAVSAATVGVLTYAAVGLVLAEPRGGPHAARRHAGVAARAGDAGGARRDGAALRLGGVAARARPR